MYVALRERFLVWRSRMTGLISWMGVVLILVACGWRLIGLTCSLADLALVHPVMTIWEMSAEL